MALTDNRPIVRDGDASGGNQDVKDALFLDFPLDQSPAYQAGRLSYDQITKTFLAHTGITDVIVNVGQETHVRFFNDTGATITNGSVVNAQGVDATNNILKGVLANSGSAATASAIIGLATEDVLDGEWGFATIRGEVRDFDTSALSTGGVVYSSDSVDGGLTQTRPQYPSVINIIGSVIKSHATEGIIFVDPVRFRRFDVSTSVSFTSQGIGSGTFYKGGFYDWGTTSTTLTQASTTQAYGTAGRTLAAHAGIVPSGPGTVDSGQVGLRVTGTEDSESGVQVASQTGIITEDITTLTADTYAETSEKFSGNVTFELYVVSGTPTTYSLTFNYGFAKYEDFFNRDASIIGLQAQWQGNANDSGMNIKLLHHKASGWTYAASGFVPGNGSICERLTDQQIESDVDTGADGAYKRAELNTFVDSGGSEGIILEITTTQNNTIQTMDINIVAVSEELT